MALERYLINFEGKHKENPGFKIYSKIVIASSPEDAKVSLYQDFDKVNVSSCKKMNKKVKKPTEFSFED